jgi:hypothetical protein
MRNILIIFYCSALLLFVSCQDDLLEQVPNNKLSTENFIPDLALTGVYDGLQNWYTGVSFQWQMGYSPLASNRYDSDQGYHGVIERGSGLTSETAGFKKFWEGLYKLVFRANFFLDNVKVMPGYDQATIDTYTAEAKFIRAYAYSQLAALYGDVPLHLTSTMTITELRKVTKNTKAEVLAQVEKDLDEAIPHLAVDVEKGRVLKGAAMALKARVKLRQNDYASVLSITNEIIALGKYGLNGETSPGVFETDAYENTFSYENENNQEVVFDIQYEGPDLGEGNGFEGYGGFKPIRDGWIRFKASKYLVDQYENIDGTPVGTAPYTVGDTRFLGRDERFYATITYPGKQIWNGDVWQPGYKIYNRASTQLLITKFVMKTDDFEVVGIRDSPLNFILIRFADVLLMNAEAKIETGDIADTGDHSAIKTINRIRARGGLSAITSTSQADLRAAVRKERLVEFAGEGLYMFDIRRWGIADVEMERDVEAFNGTVAAVNERNYSAKLLQWPIPQQEIDNTEGLVQNPLWE